MTNERVIGKVSWTKEEQDEAVRRVKESKPNKLKYFLNPFGGAKSYQQDWDAGIIEGNSLEYQLLGVAHMLELVGGAGALYGLSQLII